MVRALLVVTAIIECATGMALMAVPAWLASILLGAELGSPASRVVARLAGAALLSLGVACWQGSRDVQSRAAVGIVAAMLVYNVAAVVTLVSARFCKGMAGMGLVPVAVLHAALAGWCVACLRTTRAKWAIRRG